MKNKGKRYYDHFKSEATQQLRILHCTCLQLRGGNILVLPINVFKNGYHHFILIFRSRPNKQNIQRKL